MSTADGSDVDNLDCSSEGETELGLAEMDASRQRLVEDSLKTLLFLSLDPSSLRTLPESASWMNSKDFKGGVTRPGYPVIGTNLCSFRHEYLALEWVNVGLPRDGMFLQGTAIPLPEGVGGGEDVLEEVIEADDGEDGVQKTVDDFFGEGGMARTLEKSRGGFCGGNRELELGQLDLADDVHGIFTLGTAAERVASSSSTLSPSLGTTRGRCEPHPQMKPLVPPSKSEELLLLGRGQGRGAEMSGGGAGRWGSEEKRGSSIPPASFLPKGMLPWESSGGGASGGGCGDWRGEKRRESSGSISRTSSSGTLRSSSSLSLNLDMIGHSPRAAASSGPPSPGLLLVRGLPLTLPFRQPKRSPPSSGR